MSQNQWVFPHYSLTPFTNLIFFSTHHTNYLYKYRSFMNPRWEHPHLVNKCFLYRFDFYPINIGLHGGARMTVETFDDSYLSFWLLRCARILSITWRSSIQAMIFIAPLQWGQMLTSMLNTRFNRIDQLIALLRSSGGNSFMVVDLFLFVRASPVTIERYLLLGANTPWNRVKCTRGLGY